MVKRVESLRGLAACFGALVHETGRVDEMVATRHQSFIASHLFAGLAALAVFPVYLAVVGRPTPLTALAFVWFLSPIAIAVFLSRTGRLGAAHLLSATNLTGLVTFASALTGGITSYLVAWMIVVPLEAALSHDRRMVLCSIAIAGVGLFTLAAGTAFDLLPAATTFAQAPHVLALLGAVSALVYAGGLAVSVQTIHRKSEQVIRRGERRYRLLAENATDMITRHDSRGRIVFASVASRQIIGCPARELIGDGLFNRVHVADRPAYLAALDRCRAEQTQVSVEFRAATSKTGPDGAPPAAGDFAWMEMRCRPISDPESPGEEVEANGAAGQIVAVTRDIMERKTHEEEVLQARDAAEDANRAKTQFLANMSHELRTPLNAIIGFSEILTRELYGTLGDQRYGEYARLIHESGDHLLNVVNDILDMSKIEAGKFSIVVEPFDVSSLVESCCALMAHQAQTKRIRLVTDLEPGLPELLADKKACKQMLLNLLSNAIKFSDEGGEVIAAVGRQDGSIALSVTDNGVGIAADDLPRLGKPFVQASSSYNRSHEGTGLGLSVVKGLVHLHGGSFEIESELGKGTVTRILLPLDEEADAGRPLRSDDETAQEGDAKTIAAVA